MENIEERYVIIEGKTGMQVSAHRFTSQAAALDQIRIWQNYSSSLYTPTLAVKREGTEDVNGL